MLQNYRFYLKVYDFEMVITDGKGSQCPKKGLFIQMREKLINFTANYLIKN